MANDDPYLYSGTKGLINHEGIQDPEALQARERQLSAIRHLELSAAPPTPTFDPDHLRTIHYRLFQDIYPWAGSFRTVPISKDQSLFALPAYIEPQLERVSKELKSEGYLHQARRSDFVVHLAYYLGEVNAVHPFREGNGRTQRFFFQQLAHQAGWHLDWTQIEAAEMVEASQASLFGDNHHLTKLLDRAATSAPYGSEIL